MYKTIQTKKISDQNNMGHFVLVHGACHGAWSWYKVKPQLEGLGHRVSALDMAASGIEKRAIQEVHSMEDYSQPLLHFVASLPSHEKVILVGHSLGGFNIAYAMEKFPDKIAAGVFVSAFMPDTTHKPSYVLEEYGKITPKENWMDTVFEPYESPNGQLTSMFFGPKFFAFKLYNLCSLEDLELANTLTRPSSLFLEDLAKAKNFSENAYGSVPRVYVLCKKDEAILEKTQRSMIGNDASVDVFEIPNADHMPMLCTPQELCDVLSKIAKKYA